MVTTTFFPAVFLPAILYFMMLGGLGVQEASKGDEELWKMVLSMITSLEGRTGVSRPSPLSPHFIVPQILLFFRYDGGRGL